MQSLGMNKPKARATSLYKLKQVDFDEEESNSKPVIDFKTLKKK